MFMIFLEHALLLLGAYLLVGSDVEIVAGYTLRRIVFVLASLSAAFRVVDEVVVAMPDVHARFAGVERLITEQAEDGHCVLVGGGVRKDDDQVDVVFPVLRLLVGVLRMDAVREPAQCRQSYPANPRPCSRGT